VSVTLEVCVETVAGCRSAAAAGADRLELCANLAQGGTTASLGAWRTARAATELPLVALIRPRAGDFLFDDDEHAAMLADVEAAREIGLDGVAIGCLTAGGDVDRRRVNELVRAARPMSVTFHRAFDRVGDRERALAELIELGIDRLLTSGGARSAADGRAGLERLVARSAGRVEIIAAGSVRAENASVVLSAGVRALHASCSRPLSARSDVPLGPGGSDELGRLATDSEAVRALAAITARA